MHETAAACVTVKVFPPAVIVLLRLVVLVLAATLKATVPLPDPLAEPVKVIQATLFAAVHAQPAGAVTENEPVPPLAGTDWLDGVIA